MKTEIIEKIDKFIEDALHSKRLMSREPFPYVIFEVLAYRRSIINEEEGFKVSVKNATMHKNDYLNEETLKKKLIELTELLYKDYGDSLLEDTITYVGDIYGDYAMRLDKHWREIKEKSSQKAKEHNYFKIIEKLRNYCWMTSSDEELAAQLEKDFPKLIEDLSVSENYLSSWYQSSDKHIEEVFNDFYLIPKRGE